jgi:hypothetical protein
MTGDMISKRKYPAPRTCRLPYTPYASALIAICVSILKQPISPRWRQRLGTRYLYGILVIFS